MIFEEENFLFAMFIKNSLKGGLAETESTAPERLSLFESKYKIFLTFMYCSPKPLGGQLFGAKT